MRRRALRVLLVLIPAGLLLPPLGHLGRVALRERAFLRGPAEVRDPRQGWDASGLESAPLLDTVRIPRDDAEAIPLLQALLRRARAEGFPLMAAGARHSMGGQSQAPGGIVLDMGLRNGMDLDEAADLLRVQAGARWSEVLPYLQARGRSVAVMQSDAPFSVGGSLSVNCHGWQPGRPPIASTVQALRLMTADGQVLRCSRTEHPGLFALALGGYGLAGLILDAELRVVPNAVYRPRRERVPAEALASRLEALGRTPSVGLLYARMRVTPGRGFLSEALLTAYEDTGALPDRTPLPPPRLTFLRRCIFRGSVGSAYGKDLRWWGEVRLGSLAEGGTSTRNQLLAGDLEDFRNRDPGRTDLLHEAFVPPERLGDFLTELRRILPQAPTDLLNITVRDVRRDPDTLLRYADRDMIALVLLFNLPRTPEADAEMRTTTQALVEAALRCGGRPYLPYRLHATPEQFRRAYPQAEAFFAAKHRADPDGVFQNRLSRTYASLFPPTGTPSGPPPPAP